MGFIERAVRVVTWTAFILAACLFVVVAEAAAGPGDAWVFEADAPVADMRDHSQYKPVVSGDMVFWEDNRPGADGRTFTRIFYRDLSDPEVTELPLVADAAYFAALKKSQKAPAVDGTLLAWQEAVPSATGATAYEIRYLDFGDGCLARGDCVIGRVPVVSGHGLEPVVTGETIVWQDDRAGADESDIYLYSLTGGEVLPVCDLQGQQKQPDADGEWVVWVDNRDGEIIRGRATHNDLYISNVVTGEERKITDDRDVGLQEHPAISGDVVVYSENSGEVTRGDIKLYRISTGETSVLYAGEGFDLRPAIDGPLVAWEACPDGIDACTVWLHDLETGIDQQVSHGPREGGVAVSAAGYVAVDYGSRRIAWHDDRDGPRAIYESRATDRASVLAERHRPLLMLSTGEMFEPEPAEMMMQLPGSFLRRWPNDAAAPVRNPDNTELLACGEPDCFIDMMGSAVEAGGGERSCNIDRGLIARTYVQEYRDHEDDYPDTVYARVKQLEGTTVIQYWIHYLVNDHPRLFHEGDWEMVQVRLDGDLEPYRADYSQHTSGQWRYWGDVDKSGGSHPVVFVAAGSHASYFRAGEHALVPLYAWDVADGGGAVLSPRVEVLSEREQTAGGPGWLGFPGRWGEYTAATLCVPDVPLVFSGGGHRDGPPGPAFQGAKWDDPLGWLDTGRCDGCDQDRSESAVLGVTAWYGAEVHLYDADGNHTGHDPAGGIETGIIGAEVLEYPEEGLTVLQLPGVSADAGYRFELHGSPESGITITLPDHDTGVVSSIFYAPYSDDPDTIAWFTADGTGDYRLSVDVTGNGQADFEVEPDLIETQISDLEAPAAITDLRTVNADTGAVDLVFTAPGDDGNEGRSSSYDIRYSMMPISAESWYLATPFTPAEQPQPAGSTETITVSGLMAGTTYYFAVKAIDDAGRQGPLSTIAVARTLYPQLAWYQERVYWSSYADYRERSLTVDYMMRNKGNAPALDVTIEASRGVPQTCYPITPMPIVVGEIAPDTGSSVTIRYHVPAEAHSFTATTYARCRDSAGGEHWFPEPLIIH